MIIPVRCFTCGKVLANKWKTYEEEVKQLQKTIKKDENEDTTAVNFDKEMKGDILDKLYIERICCRRHLLSHIELIDII
jgi:DNA-directed RNA polymerase subunit N (RpoN/RPB10)